MEELHGFQKLQLVKLLAEETKAYYKLIGFSASVEECTQCNNRIKEIQKELDSRIPADERNILQREHRSAPLEYSF